MCSHTAMCPHTCISLYMCSHTTSDICRHISLHVFATSMRTHVPLYMCSLRILLYVSSYYCTSSVLILLCVCLHACMHVSSSATVCVLLNVCEPVSWRPKCWVTVEALLQLLRRQYLYFCTSKASKLSSKHLNKRHGLSRHLFGHLSVGGFVTSDVSSGIRGLVSIGGLVKSAWNRRFSSEFGWF